jgi:Peptidase_C39 like family
MSRVQMSNEVHAKTRIPKLALSLLAGLAVVVASACSSGSAKPITGANDIILGATSRASVGAYSLLSQISVPYLSQYQGQASQNYDCGPTGVAMVLQYRGLRTGGLSDMQWVSQVRTNTGVGNDYSDTSFGQLETALSYSGTSYSEVPASLTPQPDAQVAAIKDAVGAGNPVIAVVHGADLGRGEAYGDHWIVITGFSSDGSTAYVNDPDNQGARWAGWIVGGQISLPIATLSTALYDGPLGPYGIIVN